jgi:hypothetical protein
MEIQSGPGWCYLEMAEIEVLKKNARIADLHSYSRVTLLKQFSTLGQQYQSDWSTHQSRD